MLFQDLRRSVQDLQKRVERGDPATHEWTCLLRSVDGEDLSVFVKKVVFVLHPSFAQPQRVVEIPPFEVSEIGWGEFEITARIYFHDPDEKVVEIKHYLQLYPANTVDIRDIQPPQNPREMVVPAEVCTPARRCLAFILRSNPRAILTSLYPVQTYDEILFRNPSGRMLSLLTSPRPAPPHILGQYCEPH